MATPSARDMLMQVQRYANGGTASAESSVGLARALANGTSQEQYYQNIREYVAKNPNPLAALNAASENGVSTADINNALGTKAASDYFTIDYNTETAPSTNVATGFTSALAQRYNAPGGPGQSTLDRRIKEISQQYAANTPENAQILRDLFIKEGASIADVQRAGVDPSVLLGTVGRSPTFPTLPVIPAYTPPVVTPETQTQFPQPTPYTAPTVYQPLPAPPPIYAAGQPALDVPFRNSPARTPDPVYGYTYSPAAKLLAATGAGMSFTPPSVTSRPRELLKVPLPTAANPQYSASQQFARDRAAAQLAALPVGGGGRFSGMQAPVAPPLDPNAPVDPYAVKPTEFRFYAPQVAANGGEIKKSEGSAQEELALNQLGDKYLPPEVMERMEVLGRQPSAVERATYDQFGMEPGVSNRPGIIPIRENGEWIMPGWMYDAGKAFVSPGTAMRGQQVSPEDVLNTAMTFTGGSLGASGIAGPVGENILGMAVKPRGGVFRPTVTEGTVRAPSGIDNLVDGYRQALVKEGTVPTEQIDDIVAKARRYFTTAYGTAKDPLRLAILEGTLNPTIRASGFYGGRSRFRDYLLEAARRDYTTEQGVAAQVEAGTLAAEAPLRTSQSLEDFERLYDEGTGLRGTVYREEGDITPDRYAVIPAVREGLMKEGIPEERINLNINSRTPTFELRDAVDYPSLHGRDAPFYKTLIAGTDPTLKMAMEKGDPVYDIQGADLDFLSPSNIAAGIGGLPLTSLSGMTFPQMAVKGAKIAVLREDFNAVVDRATAGKPIPKTFLLENGVKKITDAGDSTWFRITDPMYTELEGAMMGHSVGGYSRTRPYGLGKKEGGGKAAFNSGLAQVYSLRNSRTGKPSITVEMTGIGDGPLRITEIYGYKNGVPSPDEWDSVFKLAKEQRVDPSDMLENRGYGRDYNGEELPERFPVPWRQLYTGYLRAADEAPTKKAKGGTVSSPMSNAELLAQMDRIGATPNAKTPDPAPTREQTESRNMLQRFTSLNTPKDMSLGETAADIAMGFAPFVGTAQGLRDFERARRDDDTLGMVLGAASVLPGVSGAVKAARTVGKAAKAADDLAELTARTPQKFIDTLPGRNELSYWVDGGQDAVERGFPEEPFILLDRLYIDPQNRGQGAARQVLKEGLQEMAEKYPGMKVWLLAEPLDRLTNHHDLVRLYESVGFDVDNYQDGMSSIPMSMRLPSKPESKAQGGYVTKKTKGAKP